MIAKFEFKVTVHYSLWAKCTQLWPLNTTHLKNNFGKIFFWVISITIIMIFLFITILKQINFNQLQCTSYSICYRMISLREVIFLGCALCVSCQTNMTTEMSNTTSPPITEPVTELATGNVTTQPLTMTTTKGTTTMMTSLQPTTAGTSPSEAAQSTAAATSTDAMETSAQRSTHKGTTIVTGTTYVKVTTKKKSKAFFSCL